MNVVPQLLHPVKADSVHNILYINVRLTVEVTLCPTEKYENPRKQLPQCARPVCAKLYAGVCRQFKPCMSTQTSPTPAHQEFITGFLSDENCRLPVVARVASTVNQLIQPHYTFFMVECFTIAIVDVVEQEVSTPPHRPRIHGWCESAEPMPAFISALTVDSAGGCTIVSACPLRA